MTTSSGVLCDVFHHFSSVASALCHAASPVVPGLYVVGMALKELDNIVQKNQIADVRLAAKSKSNAKNCLTAHSVHATLSITASHPMLFLKSHSA